MNSLDFQEKFKKINNKNENEIINVLVNDISDAIHETMEEVDIFDYDFKKQLLIVVRNILKNIESDPDPVTIYYEAIPGFTLIALKKEKLYKSLNQKKELKNNNKLNNKMENNQNNYLNKDSFSSDFSDVVESLTHQFFEKTEAEAMVIENDLIYFMFFPVENIKDNLKKLGFYYTDNIEENTEE